MRGPFGFLGRLFGSGSDAAPDFNRLRPGDEISGDGESWTVKAIVHYRTADNEWPIVELQRGTRTVWTAYEDGKAVRYDPAPDLHLTQGQVVWRGRAYTEAETGTATIARVAGDVDAAAGDHLSYHTLTSSEDPAHWISVESWDSGHVEISIGQTWSVNRIGRRT